MHPFNTWSRLDLLTLAISMYGVVSLLWNASCMHSAAWCSSGLRVVDKLPFREPYFATIDSSHWELDKHAGRQRGLLYAVWNDGCIINSPTLMLWLILLYSRINCMRGCFKHVGRKTVKLVVITSMFMIGWNFFRYIVEVIFMLYSLSLSNL